MLKSIIYILCNSGCEVERNRKDGEGRGERGRGKEGEDRGKGKERDREKRKRDRDRDRAVHWFFLTMLFLVGRTQKKSSLQCLYILTNEGMLIGYPVLLFYCLNYSLDN